MIIDATRMPEDIERGAEGGPEFKTALIETDGGNEIANIDITNRILDLTGRDARLIRHVADRPGHDRRYALATDKLRGLGWAPQREFDRAIEETVAWYTERRDWWEPIKSGEYRAYYEEQYGNR